MKVVLKLVLFSLCTFLILPLLAIAKGERLLTTGESLFQGISQLLSLIPFKPGVYLRAAFYANACTLVHREVTIGFTTLLSHSDTNISHNVYIGPQSNIGSCYIGQDCVIGSSVHILSGKHQHGFSSIDKPIREQDGIYEKISIGNDCWIGNQSTILASIGNHCIVAAGSVVVDEVPPRSIVAGNPARIIKTRQ